MSAESGTNDNDVVAIEEVEKPVGKTSKDKKKDKKSSSNTSESSVDNKSQDKDNVKDSSVGDSDSKKLKKSKEEKRKEKEEKRTAKAREKEDKKSKRRSWIARGSGNSSASIPPGSPVHPSLAHIAAQLEAEGADESAIKKRQSWKASKDTSSTSTGTAQRQRELEQFLLNIPQKKLAGTTWKYYDVSPEDGFDETMVMLHAGGVRVEAMYEQLLGLAKEFRVIAPLFPEELNEIEDYVAGLILIMRHENIKRAHFYGDSFGALVAHHFVYRHPTRVLSCTLVHAICPSEMRANSVRKALKKLDSYPVWAPIQRMLTGFGVKGKDIEEQVTDLEAGEKEQLLTMLRKFAASRTALVARLEAILDLFTNCEYTPEKFARFNGRLLLIESEDDPTFDAANFDKLSMLHPNACVHYFKGSGLLMPLVRSRRIIQLIAKFLTDEESESVTRSHHDQRTTNDDTEDATSKDIVFSDVTPRDTTPEEE